MSKNDINSFMNNRTHSTWLVVLTIMNLPPWLCNKWKYIMILGLTSTQQPGNDIDTYFRPLVEDLKVLWYNNGLQVWDEHKCYYFQLKAILFVSVSDSLVRHNLSGQNKKVGYECPHYFGETNSQYLSESQNIVYMGYRLYILMKHQFQNMND
jgi:hypothetical protein